MKKADNTFTRSKAVLDYSPSCSLLYLAHQAGLVKYADKPEFEDEVIASYRSDRTKRHALESVLLYEELDIVSTEKWDVSQLTTALPVSLHKYIESNARSDSGFIPGMPMLDANQVEAARMVKHALLPHMRRRFGIRTTDYDGWVNLMASPDYTFNMVAKGLKHKIPPFFEIYLMEAVHLIQRSGSSNSAIISERLGVGQQKFIDAKIVEQVSQPKSLNQAFAVVCDAVRFFPVARNLEEALELRSSARIKDFRGVLWEWAGRLQNNDLDGEKSLRQELSKANTELRKLDSWRPVARFLTYLSLPLAVVPYIGLPLAVLGASVQVRIDRIEWKHRWLLIKG